MKKLPNRTTKFAWKQLGKVALGKKDGSRPVDLNYFIFKEKGRDAKFYYSERLHAIIGAQPTELDIIIPFATADECLHDRRVKYGSNGLPSCRSDDGIRAKRWVRDGEKPILKDIVCLGSECPFQKDKSCKDKAVFIFMVPQIDAGTFHLDTGSMVGVENIINALETMERICADQGRPNGIAFLRCKLVREAVALNVEGKRTVKYILNLHIDFNALMQGDKALLGPILGQKVEALAAPAPTLKISAAEIEAVDAE